MYFYIFNLSKLAQEMIRESFDTFIHNMEAEISNPTSFWKFAHNKFAKESLPSTSHAKVEHYS